MNQEIKNKINSILDKLETSEDLIQRDEIGIPDDQIIQHILYSLGIIIGAKGTSRIRIYLPNKEEKKKELENFFNSINQIEDKLKNSSDGILTRQQVIEVLRLNAVSEDKYYDLLSIMSLASLATSAGRSRTGGLQRYKQDEDSKAEGSAKEELVNSPKDSSDYSKKESEHEEVLYPKTAKLVSELGYQAKIIGRKRRFPGEWNTPDLVGYKLRNFKVLSIPDIEIITVECKWNISKYAIAEAISHQRFAHYTYLMVNQSLDEINSDYREDIILQGIGLITLQSNNLNVIIPAQYNNPDSEQIDEFLSLVLENDEINLLNEEISTRIYNQFIKNKIKFTIS